MAPKLNTVPGTAAKIPDRRRHISCQLRPVVDVPDMIVHPVEARMASHYRVMAKLENAWAKRLRKDDLDELVMDGAPSSQQLIRSFEECPLLMRLRRQDLLTEAISSLLFQDLAQAWRGRKVARSGELPFRSSDIEVEYIEVYVVLGPTIGAFSVAVVSFSAGGKLVAFGFERW